MISPVLVSWIAVNNDPFERERGSYTPRLVGGARIPGPTLTLLFDEDSPWREQIRDVVLLHREVEGPDGEPERRAIAETRSEIERLQPQLRLRPVPWPGSDPTDHQAIFEFLQPTVRDLRREFAGRTLVVHISPGTPSMQTIWVLMGETGLIEQPFELVKSYRRDERRGRPPVLKVQVGLETFFKAYVSSHPREVGFVDQAVVLDPSRFRSERMKRLLVEARRFAQLNVPVLLLGERGTGKTTLAGWMRAHSGFRKKELDKGWPAVACGQYSPETMRAELFGYRKGAFTGALQDREGLLATADGDTLFLDEIGDVSGELQRLLIKALEEGRFQPLGAKQPSTSRFRLLAATNLSAAVLRQRLDADFLDRISALSLHLPPLREIREDLGWLWEAAYDQAAARSEAAKTRLGTSHHQRVASRLAKHHLPGNMRDLFRVAYRIVAARNDVHEPLGPGEAVEYGLAALDDSEPLAPTEIGIARNVAQAFAADGPLDHVVAQHGRIETAAVERGIKAFMARKIRELAKQRHVDVETLCDVTGRSLQSWLRAGAKVSS
jgi:DNA-binding NtrC family response regulator